MNFLDEEETRTNESPSSVESPFTIKTPSRCRNYLPQLKEGKASNEHKEKRISMYPSTVHMDITSMVPRCTTMDLDLKDALDSPTEETWVMNHHKLRCLACMWSPSNKRRTGSSELDNRSDFFFVKKYGNGMLPTNTYLTLCEECVHSNNWTSFPVSEPSFIKYGTLSWKLALDAPNALHGQKLRPIKATGVEAKETPRNKRLKETTVERSPLSNTTCNLPKMGTLFNTQID